MLMKYDKPPDGGWGWLVVVNGFLSYGVVWSIPRSFAVLFVDFMREFGTNKAETSWITSLMFGVAAMGSLPGSFLTIVIGARRTVIIGGLLSFLGLIILSQSSHIMIAYAGSLIAGLGFGFSYANATPQIGSYFDQKRAFATSISASGTPIHGLFMPVLIRYLRDLYGWRGAVLIFAAYSLHISVGGCLLRPVRVASLVSTRESEEEEGRSRSRGYAELFGNWRMLLFMLHGFQDFSMRLSTTWFIVLYASKSFEEVDTEQASLLLVFFAITDSVSRPLTGYICSLLPHRMIVGGVEIGITGVIQITMSLSILLIPFSSSYAMVGACLGVIGWTNGSNGALCFPINSRLNKPHNITQAVGIFHFWCGLGLMLGPPFAGFLADSMGRMDVIFFYLSGVGFTSGGVLLLLYALAQKYGIRPPEEMEEEKEKPISC